MPEGARDVGTRPDRTTARALTLIAVAGALFGEPLSEAGIDRVLVSFEDRLRRVSFQTRMALHLMLAVHRYAPIFTGVSMRRLDALPLASRERTLEALDHAKLAVFSLLFAGLKTMLAIDYLDGPAELHSIGYTEGRKRYLVKGGA